MSLLVVGSVAFDALETPFGKVERTLGGAATYFSVAASYFTRVNLVGVVGDDFNDEHAAIFRGRHKDVEANGTEAMTDIWREWPGVREAVELPGDSHHRK